MIKLSIIHFPKGIRLDESSKHRAHTFATKPPYASSATNLPKAYTVSFINLSLTPEQEQEFLQLVRQHQQMENGFNTANRLNMGHNATATKLTYKTAYKEQGKALRGLRLMSSYIYNLSSTKHYVSKIQILTSRETDVTGLLCQGLLDKEIADLLHISINTVRNHLKNIYTKLGTKNRSETLGILLSVYLK